MSIRTIAKMILISLTAASVYAGTPGIRIINSTSIASLSGYIILPSFDTVQHNSGFIYNPTFYGSKVLLSEPGCYSGGYGISFSQNSNGIRSVSVIATNTNDLYGPQITIHSNTVDAQSLTSTKLSGSFYYCFADANGKSFWLQTYQDSGSTLNINASGEFSPVFWLQKVSDF